MSEMIYWIWLIGVFICSVWFEIIRGALCGQREGLE